MAAAKRVHGSPINLESAPQMAEYAAAADRIAAAGHAEVLDWGCGYGQLTVMLRERGVSVASMDYDPTVDGTVTRPLERYPAVEATFTNDPVHLPYDDGRFDAVLSMGVLEHVAHPHRSLGELRRVLCPGGIVYCYKLPNRRSYLEAIARRTGQYYHGQLEHDTLWTVPEARAAFDRAGFEVLEVRLMNMLPLTLPGRVATAAAPTIYRANRLLSSLPVLRTLATNIELVARAPAE
jgi:2-polyprenyl-3-methyl-5-hydroxy-6-metoxy-1,4-benzoquinol methylase